ncbi:MAG TPA: hypothetical protein VK631_08680 [Solirubrobacteraceae bacterium]|nr:hypothetical protein [Solirubrobacteraceae bacterium]
MAAHNPVRAAILAAIELVQRNGEPLTTKYVRANVKTGGLSLDDTHEALRKHINAQIPVVMKELGLIIADPKTRERKDFWTSSPADLEEQARIKKRSNQFDTNRIACDEAVIAFLREKEKDFGYPVYPGLFHAEIDRIYAMHSLVSPGASREAA